MAIIIKRVMLVVFGNTLKQLKLYIRGHYMFVNFDSMFEPYEVDIETYIEDKVVNKQTIEAPQQMIIANFLQLMNQAKDDKRPLKIRMTRPEIIWNNFENKQKVLTNEISFSNNAMIAFEENKVNNDD